MLHVESVGNPLGPVVVFLHGFMGAGSDWLPIAEKLPEYHCICVDLPGHGTSPCIRAYQNGFAVTHQQLVETLKHHGITRYSLIGYSLGGRIAAYHAAQHPKGLHNLILESANPGLGDDDACKARKLNDHRWAERLRHEPLPQVLADWYRQPVFAHYSAAQIAHQIDEKSQRDAVAMADMLEATGLGRQPNLLESLPLTTLPVTLIHGAEDAKFTSVSKRWEQAWPRVKRYAIEEAGHNAHVEQSAEFVRIIRDVCQSCESLND